MTAFITEMLAKGKLILRRLERSSGEIHPFIKGMFK
jgi:hypothetical protein